MIFKLKFEGKGEFVQAKSIEDLKAEYEKEYYDNLEDCEISELSEDEAKKIMLANPEYDENDPDDLKEISLFDSVVGEDFCIIGSTDWD